MQPPFLLYSAVLIGSDVASGERTLFFSAMEGEGSKVLHINCGAINYSAMSNFSNESSKFIVQDGYTASVSFG
jgi:hypothetical protein